MATPSLAHAVDRQSLMNASVRVTARAVRRWPFSNFNQRALIHGGIAMEGRLVLHAGRAEAPRGVSERPATTSLSGLRVSATPENWTVSTPRRPPR